MLPESWSWRGARVLDFGCGAGRVLRHFADEAEHAEFWGCDVHVPSIEWVQTNLNPPFRAVACNEEPGLPFPDGFFTLIYATSVFTHLTEHATGWLLELRRTLADGGLLLLTFLGAGMIHEINEPWDEDRIGFNTLRHGYPWDIGGPLAFISPWWIREHWGRAFEIVELRQFSQPGTHDLALLRKRLGHFSAVDIDRLASDEPREIRALQHNVRQLSNESIELRRQIADQMTVWTAAHDNLAAENARLAKENDRLVDEVNERCATLKAVTAACADRAIWIRQAQRRHSWLRRLRYSSIPLPRLKKRRTRAKVLIGIADRARDAREWVQAAQNYREALSLLPDNAPIWVQYGHALKASGYVAEAETAYRRSVELDASVADTHLQLAQSLKLQGRRDEAVAAYLRAITLDPGLSRGSEELMVL